MKLRRKLNGMLSTGHGIQLLWLVVILVLSFLVFFGISELVFRDGVFNWQDILALYLDPGVFGGAGRHDLFRLVITLTGVFLFAALLINVVGNIFENVVDSHNKGETRYGFKGHILILGANQMLLAMLRRLLDEDAENLDEEEREMQGRPIVVMTTRPVEELRKRVEATFGKSRLKLLRDRVTFYYDERDNLANLTEAHAPDAYCIYILGEDDEPGHDSVSLSCLEKLDELCGTEGDPIKCYVTLESPVTSELFHYLPSRLQAGGSGSRLLLNTLNVDEYVAERVLLGLNGKGQLPIDGRGYLAEKWEFLHFAILGSSPMAWTMARAAAHLCHFPCADGKTGHTVISVIDSGIRTKMDRFVSENAWLFRLSHYSLIKPGQETEIHEPDPAYGDFLDIRWEFIEADPFSAEARELISGWAADPARHLSLAICRESAGENLSLAFHLPDPLYKRSAIYVNATGQDGILGLAEKTRRFGNVFGFGAGTASDPDPLLTRRVEMGQRVNYVYARLYESVPPTDHPERLWYLRKEADKFSSIHNANSIDIKVRSLPLSDSYGPDGVDPAAMAIPCRMEHLRWMMAELLMGFRPYPAADRAGYLARVREESPTDKRHSPTWKMLKERRMQTFEHIDIAPLEELIDEEEKNKDIDLFINIPFILGQRDSILRYDHETGSIREV